tara:strand:+ start:2426 stop:2689 length:264 start_codon:yes stop_codon:yes gene_type:complete
MSEEWENLDPRSKFIAGEFIKMVWIFELNHKVLINNFHKPDGFPNKYIPDPFKPSEKLLKHKANFERSIFQKKKPFMTLDFDEYPKK